ncbi:hypothetical protein L1887_60518 [Cichorium endivia]|nr:hypothetical protein L1887_60518 [Cichorium endivia]
MREVGAVLLGHTQGTVKAADVEASQQRYAPLNARCTAPADMLAAGSQCFPRKGGSSALLPESQRKPRVASEQPQPQAKTTPPVLINFAAPNLALRTRGCNQ